MSCKKRKLIYDCDPGTDDSVCILMALTHPEIDLLAITTESGNFPADVSANHALKILEYIGREDIPVAQGMLKPLARPYPSDPYSHGEDGLGNHFFPEPNIKPVNVFAPQLIADTVMKYPEEVSIVCTAPLTNLALAIMMKPEIVPMIKDIYHLGGAYGFNSYAWTNATGDNPMSEWNIFVDPEAAKTVYESELNLTTIGLDIAFNPDMVNIDHQTIDKLKLLNNKQSRYALEIIDYVDGNNSIKEKELFINGPIDTTCMCAFIRPEILTTKTISVTVDTGGPLTCGMTIWDRRDHFRWEHLPKIRTAVSINSELYRKTFVEALGGRLGG